MAAELVAIPGTPMAPQAHGGTTFSTPLAGTTGLGPDGQTSLDAWVPAISARVKDLGARRHRIDDGAGDVDVRCHRPPGHHVNQLC